MKMKLACLLTFLSMYSTMTFAETDLGEKSLLHTLTIKEAKYGKEDLSLIPTLDSLAFLYLEKNAFGKAEKTHTRIIEIKKLHHGNEHPEVVASLRDLGLFYFTNSQFEHAKTTLLEVKEIEDKILHSDYDTLTTLNNLAGVYGALSEFSEQEKILKKSLAITLKHVPEKSAEVAEAMHRLGVFYLSGRENTKKAETFLKKALQINETLDEKDLLFHSVILNNLADLYRKKGNEDEARNFNDRADEILE
jgi:tetratricopeptide (TPR) repeat protein